MLGKIPFSLHGKKKLILCQSAALLGPLDLSNTTNTTNILKSDFS